MSRNPCLSPDGLARFVDADLAPESAQRVNQHVSRCQTCSEQVRDLRSLVAAIGATQVNDLDVTAHVRAVMHQIEQPMSQARRPRAMARIAAITAIAVAFAVVAHVVVSRDDATPGRWQARGSSKGESLSRDIGVQVYTVDESLRPLHPGDFVAPDAALTAGLRNLGHMTAHVLLFAVDSHNAVHWITPRYTQAGQDPAATELVSSPSERVLPTSVVFDDLAPGPVRIVTIISPAIVRVSRVESLTAPELGSASLAQRFIGAEVREIVVYVSGVNHGEVP